MASSHSNLFDALLFNNYILDNKKSRRVVGMLQNTSKVARLLDDSLESKIFLRWMHPGKALSEEMSEKKKMFM